MKIRAPRIYIDTHVRHPEIESGGNKTPNDRKKKNQPTVTVLNVNFSKVHYGNLVDLPKVTKIEPEEIDEVGLKGDGPPSSDKCECYHIKET